MAKAITDAPNTPSKAVLQSIHRTDKVVDELLAVAVLSTLNEVQALLVQATSWGVELEGPQEVGALREGWSHIVDLVDQVLYADDVVLPQLLDIEKSLSYVVAANACSSLKMRALNRHS